MMPTTLLTPDWPVSTTIKGVRAFFSTRAGGVSKPPFSSFNVALHTGDIEASVQENRLRLAQACAAQEVEPAEIALHWLDQVHGTDIISPAISPTIFPAIETKTHSARADGWFTKARRQACCIMTADCLPVLMCDKKGHAVAAVHVGWRGLAAGIIEAGIAKFDCPASDVMVWLGPAISQMHYEVGAEVLSECAQSIDHVEPYFLANPVRNKHYFLDLSGLAAAQFYRLGVENVVESKLCTFQDERFYSYRREGVTGRMVCGIYLA